MTFFTLSILTFHKLSGQLWYIRIYTNTVKNQNCLNMFSCSCFKMSLKLQTVVSHRIYFNMNPHRLQQMFDSSTNCTLWWDHGITHSLLLQTEHPAIFWTDWHIEVLRRVGDCPCWWEMWPSTDLQSPIIRRWKQLIVVFSWCPAMVEKLTYWRWKS